MNSEEFSRYLQDRIKAARVAMERDSVHYKSAEKRVMIQECVALCLRLESNIERAYSFESD